jgi:hypothetical protein
MIETVNRIIRRAFESKHPQRGPVKRLAGRRSENSKPARELLDEDSAEGDQSILKKPITVPAGNARLRIE